MGNVKIAAGVALKFLGKLAYPEKCTVPAAFANKFRWWTLPRIFAFVEIRMCAYYLIHVYLS